ncbi:MAG: transcriptional repressor [Patescibacteria group bacterium]
MKVQKKFIHPSTSPLTPQERRLTKQRLGILDHLRHDPSHPTAQEIFQAVRRRFPTISFGTVYRNLNFLTQRGYIKEFVIDRTSRYEGRVDSHVHLVCQQCGAIEDLSDPALAREAKRLSGTRHFYARTDNLELRGICATCQRRTPVSQQTPELFCIACGSLLDDLKREAPVCQSCCFQTSCTYCAPRKQKVAARV